MTFLEMQHIQIAKGKIPLKRVQNPAGHYYRVTGYSLHDKESGSVPSPQVSGSKLRSCTKISMHSIQQHDNTDIPFTSFTKKKFLLQIINIKIGLNKY